MSRNILIDPQRLGTANPNIQFSGSMANTIKLEVLTSGSVQFTGVSGSLLSIVDSLSGSLFAVSDVSGLPILETFSDDRVVMGRFGTNALVVTGSFVGIGTSNPATRLHLFSSTADAMTLASAAGTTYIDMKHSTSTTFGYVGNGGMVVGASTSDVALRSISGGVVFATAGGAERMRVDSVGNIGIGTSTPTARLFVSGAVNSSTPTMIVKEGVSSPVGGAALLDVQNSAGTSILLVSGSGTVGISNSNVLYAYSQGMKLDVRGNIGITNGGAIFIGDGTSFYRRLIAQDISPTNVLRVGADTAQFGTLTLSSQNSADLFALSQGNVGIGSTSPTARFQVSGSATASTPTMIVQEGVANPTGGVGVFSVRNSAGTSLFFVSGSGNIGIGTIPVSTDRLFISGTTVSSGSIFPSLDNTYDLGSPSKRWANIYATNFSPTSVTAQLTGSNLVNGMVLFAGATGGITGSQSQFFWDNTNNRLGVRTSSPSYPLDVSGDAYLRNLVYVGSGQAIRNVGGAGSVYFMDLGRATFRDGTGANLGGILEASSLYVGTTYWGTALSNGSAAFAGSVGIGTTNPDAKLTLSGSSDLATFYNSSGTKQLTVQNSGDLSFNTSTTLGLVWGNASLKFNGQLIGVQVVPFTSAYVGFSVVGKASQTYALQTWQNSAGTVLSLVDANGSVGLGITTVSSPLTTRLIVSGSSTASDQTMLVKAGVASQTGPVLEVENNVGSTLFIVSGSGNVGIGTNNPGAKLDIASSTASTQQLRFTNEISPTNYWEIGRDHVTTGDLVFRTNTAERARFDNSGNFLPAVDNSTSLGSPTRRWANVYAANISGSLTGSNLTAGQVVVAGTGGLLSGTNQFVWDNTNSRVGIGTATPSYAIDARVPGNTVANLGGAGLGGSLYFGNGASQINHGNNEFSFYTLQNKGITFYPNNTFAAVMVPAGRVGIGGTNPLARFEVTGSGSGAGATMHLLNSSNTSLMYVRDDGYVGIGTNTPTVSEKLSVIGSMMVGQGTANTSATYLHLTSGGGSYDALIDFGYYTTFDASLWQIGRNGATGQFQINDTSSGFSNNALAVTVTTRNVGIGTTSILARLHVSGSSTATTPTLLVRHGILDGSNLPVMNIQDAGGNSLLFVSGGGPVGIGTTVISPWNPIFRTLQVGSPGYFSVSAQTTAGSAGSILWNAYGTGDESFAYSVGGGDRATRYRQQYDFRWYVAGPSGATGSPVTFSESMRLDSSGNLNVGTSASNGNRVAISGGNLSVSGSVLPGDNAATNGYDLGSTTYRWRDLYARTGSFSGDLSIAGNLTVLGSSSIINSTIVSIGDNIVQLNTQSPTLSTGGLYVADTTANITGSMIWDSSTDRWRAGFVGSEINIVTTGSSDTLRNKTIPITGVDPNNISGGTAWGAGFFNGSGNLASTAAGTSGQLLQSAGSGAPTWVSPSSIIATNNIITGSGTTNYIAKFSSGNAITNSVMYDNGTNVGIGTATPGFKLDVSGSFRAQGSKKVFFNSSFPPNYPGYIYDRIIQLDTSFSPSTGGTDVRINNSVYQTGRWIVEVTLTGDLNGTGVGVSCLQLVFDTTVNNGGSGYNTINPKLYVNDTTAGSYYGSITGQIALSTSNQDLILTIAGSSTYSTGLVSIKFVGSQISGTAPTMNLTLPGTTTSNSWIKQNAWVTPNGSSNLIAAYTADVERLRVNSSGNVGIGGTNPTSRLEVTGSTGDSSAASLHLINASGASIFYARNDQYVGVGTSTLTSGRAITTVADLDVYGIRIGRGPGNFVHNTVVGNNAMAGGSTANLNTVMGYEALYSSGGTQDTVAIGWRAGRAYSGNYSVIVGTQALYESSGNYHVAIGENTLLYATTGNYNVAVGFSSLQGVSGQSSAGSNTAIGYASGYSITTGGQNVMGGYAAGYYTSVGASNVHLGYQAGYNNTSGSQQVSIGLQAGYSYTTQNDGVSIGRQAALNQTGATNVAVGGAALLGVSGQSNASLNVAIGHLSGYSVTTGGNNFFGGHQSGYSVTTGGQNVLLGFQAGYNTSVATYATAIGYQAGYNLTSGSYNVLVGNSAGKGLTTGASNTLLGHQSGFSSTTVSGLVYIGSNSGVYQSGAQNTAVGQDSLFGVVNNTNNATLNTAIGNSAGYSVTTGGSNFFGGAQSGYNVSVATNNVLLGYQSAYTLTSGSNQVIIGYQAGYSLTTGDQNVIVGRTAGYTLTGEQYNTFVGMNAGRYIKSSQNTSLGFDALLGQSGGTSTGAYNVAIGYGAGRASQTGNNNVYMGYQAGLLATDGSNNTFIGYQAGDSVTTGANNVILGSGADLAAATNTNSIVIGQGAVGIGSNTTVLGNSSTTTTYIPGNVGVNTTTPQGAANAAARVLQVYSSDTSSNPAEVRVSGNTGTSLSIAQGTAASYLWSTGNFPLTIGTNGASKVSIDATGHVTPAADNTQNLGSSTLRWKNVYAATGSISNLVFAPVSSGNTYTTTFSTGESGRLTATKTIAQNTNTTFFVIAAGNGAHLFDVGFVVSESGFSVTRKYTVASQYGTTSASVVSFKVVDTGPYLGYDLTVTFTKNVSAQTVCTVSHNYTTSTNIAITIDIAAVSSGGTPTTVTIF